jgi:hypothetical protein
MGLSVFFGAFQKIRIKEQGQDFLAPAFLYVASV